MASFLSTPLINAETAIASDSTFRTWSSATSEADAKANYIFSDDSKTEAELPANYAAITEMQNWSYTRRGLGAGRANFLFTSGQFTIVFIEDVGDGLTDYTPANRIAFKDTIAGFISNFIANFEATGMRLASVSEVPESPSFPFRGQTEEGRYIYNYGVICELDE